MPYTDELHRHIETFRAEEDMSAAKGLGLVPGTNQNGVAIAGAAAADVIAVARENADSGAVIGGVTDGLVLGVSGDAVTKGAPVTTDGDGKWVDAAAGEAYSALAENATTDADEDVLLRFPVRGVVPGP